MERVVIFGNGSVAAMAHYELDRDSAYEVTAFTVDRDLCSGEPFHGKPLVPFDEVSSRYPPGAHRMLVAVGYVDMNRLRAARCAEARATGYRLISHVSPRAITWSEITTGENTFISAGAVVHPSASIGHDVFVGACCVLAHDCVIGDHCFFSDSVTLAGGVTVGDHCFFGTGAVIRNRVTIGRECVVGAGAVILADADERGVYMGRNAEKLPIPSDRLNLA